MWIRFTATSIVLTAFTAGSGVAQGIMNAEEFDAFTRGKTFYYGVDGNEYGAEEYLPNRRVIWTFLDGQCQNGIWYEANGMICFEYEQIENRQCWTFHQSDNGGLIARFQDDPEELDFWETGVLEPHLILADLISIFHPEILPGHELKYYARLD